MWHGGSEPPLEEGSLCIGVGCCTVSAEASSSWPGELRVDGLLLPVLRTVGLRHRGHPGVVGDRGVHRPLAGAHVAEGWVQAGALARRVAVVGVGATLVL